VICWIRSEASRVIRIRFRVFGVQLVNGYDFCQYVLRSLYPLTTVYLMIEYLAYEILLLAKAYIQCLSTQEKDIGKVVQWKTLRLQCTLCQRAMP
jgi:hypothetical protein